MLALALLLSTSLSLPRIQGSAAAPTQETPAQEFRRIGQELYDNDNPYCGSGLRKSLEQALKSPALDPEKRIEVMTQLGKEYLKGTQVEQSIQTLEAALELSKAGASKEVLLRLHRHLALSYLRLAEQENCIRRHNADCCIFPLHGGGIHVEREPAIKAREQYLEVLRLAPDDKEALWLLNITTMALGEYPDGVPEAWRLPAKAFASEAEFPRFHDVAPQAGVDILNMAGGAAVEDYDGDGWLDILTSTCDPRGSLRYFHSRGDGTFEDRTESSAASAQLGGLNLISGDYDEDGDQDAVVLRGGWLVDFGCIRRSLLRNDGGEHFEDVTRKAGLAEPAYPSQTAVFGDFDADGSLDLYVGNESCVEVKHEDCMGDYPSQLFHNDGHGVFTDVAAEAGVRNDRYAKGVAAGDYDDDGDLDLYVSNIGYNRLYRNDGKGRFADVAPEAGVLEPIGRSFACWFFDYDQDGHLDLWVNAYSASIADLAAEALMLPHKGVSSCLYRNLGNGRFEDVAAKVGIQHPWLAMASNFGDGDGDGWLDVYLGTGDPHLQSLMPNVYLHNIAGERFVNETDASGLGHLQKGHGIGFADLDGDGDQDIFHKMGGFLPVDAYASALFENRSPPGHHWLVLSLVGTRTNRDAVGARVRVDLETAAGPRALYRAMGSVSSFGGSPHRLEIGLGDARRIARLEVRWPNGGATQVFEDVPLDASLRITEGEPAFRRLEYRSFHF